VRRGAGRTANILIIPGWDRRLCLSTGTEARPTQERVRRPCRASAVNDFESMTSHEHPFPELRLIQITDSAFPLGSFAFSSGLESSAKLGLIENMPEFKKYLVNVLTQISCSEMPFVNSSYKCAADDVETLAPIFERLEAFITVPCMRKASITQGRSLLQAVKAVYPEHNFQAVIRRLQDRGLFTHYAAVFGMVSRIISLSHIQTLSAYAYIALRDQVSAAIRLGLLGPHEAQSILRETLGHVNETIDRVKALEYREAFKMAVALEIAQAHHPKLYSHLFQN
jgi:urease accessory protein